MNNEKHEVYRVVIDTNIWISFLIGKQLVGLHRHVNGGRIQIITCKEQILELSNVLGRSRIRKYISQEHADEFLELLLEVAVIVTPEVGKPICRDSKDDYLLYTAIAANADYLVSGDNDLLCLVQVGNTQILSFADFELLMGREV